MASSTVIGAFPRFPDLPAEIRLMIWRECLPHRVHELDSDEFYATGPGGFARVCGLLMTTQMNHRPPAISRVCRESRVVALQNRVRLPYEEMLEEAFWASETILDGMIDPSRDSVHLNWEPWDERFEGEGYYLDYLAWHAANSQGGSVGYESIDHEDVAFLDSISNLVIVMRKIIIHATSEYGARTGLFGLLGDAPVQLVDLSNEKRLKAYFDLAEETQKKGHVTFAQDLHRKPCEVLEEEFQKIMGRKYQRPFGLRPGEMPPKLPPLRGAIMFRLCTDMCNNSEDAEEGFRPLPGTTWIPPIQTQGRGRGGLRGGPIGSPFRMRGRLRNKIVA
ncbi:uncharacterized protein N7482_002023 [Penicillium canariense]|uniref:2EXR domain-containing protein n=1 Tax=Penicillium canariense TaxID=189055 RepID=A0A9W9II88_9EURO|nr:uncharacterized protein N7482_002023 [Penicillium canariense]KAJ5176146.1 hypothetical protein N7482_002023 [Penicillium canariense]